VGRRDGRYRRGVIPPDLHIVKHHPHADGPPVVLVHGAPDRSKNFAKVLHLLPDLPITVYDRRGYGKSLNAQPPSDGFNDQADDLIAILDGRPSVVCGQSAGGAITLMAASRAPELFLSVGVWEPPMPWAEWWPKGEHQEWMPRWLSFDPPELGETYNKELIGLDRWQALPERTRDMLRAEGSSFRADLLSQLRPPFDMADLRCPVVVGAGTIGMNWMLEGCRRLAAQTDAEFFLADGANHVAHTDHPEVWAELVRRAVARAAT
jgi:pimeloyl-ACP methyl ester carboxylesterase